MVLWRRTIGGTAESFEKQKVGLDVQFSCAVDALIRSIIVNMNAFCYEDMVSGWNLLDIGVPAHKGVGDKHVDTEIHFPWQIGLTGRLSSRSRTSGF